MERQHATSNAGPRRGTGCSSRQTELRTSVSRRYVSRYRGFAILIAFLFSLHCTATLAVEQASTANLAVSGKYIVNGSGQRLFLHGVNYFGPLTCQNPTSESHTLPNQRTFVYTPGPSSLPTYYERLRTQWNINNIRFMLNEYCWLRNESETDWAGSGSNWRTTATSRTYQQAVIAMVQAARQANLAVIITLGAVRDANFRTNAALRPSLRFGDPSMAAPNRLNSADFWASVADTFRVSANALYSGVMFETYNEPTLYFCGNPPGGSINGNQCGANCLNFEYDADRSWLCQLHGDSQCNLAPVRVRREKVHPAIA